MNEHCQCDHLFAKLILLLLLATKCSCKFADVENCGTDNRYYAHDSVHLIPKQLPNPQGYNISDYKWSYEAKFNENSSWAEAGRKPPDLTKYMQKLHDSVYELFIPPYVMPTTYYIIKVYARRLNSRPGPIYAFNEHGKNYKECLLYFVIHIPTVVITGGHGKTVPPNLDIVVSGDDTYDPDLPSRTNTHLKFLWTCRQTKTPATFCEKGTISTDSRFTIPANMVEDRDVIEITLNVSKKVGVMPYSPIQYVAVLQKIFVIENAAHLEIGKNCPPVSLSFSNYQTATVVVVHCIANCDGIKEQDYKWTVRDTSMNELPNFDYDKHSRFGQIGSRFVLERRSLTKGVHRLRVDLQSVHKSQSYAYIDIKYIGGVIVTHCSTQPTQGNSFDTEFRLTCEQHPKSGRNFYELIVRNANDMATERIIIDGIYPNIQEKVFKLPPSAGKSFVVRIKKKFHPDIEVGLKVDVVSPLDNKTGQEIAQYVDNIYRRHSNQSITQMIIKNDPQERQKALELFQIVVDELIVPKLQDPELISFIENFKYTTVEDLLQAPFETIQEIMAVSHALTSLAYHNVSTKDNNPLLAKYISTVCKKMADRSIEFMKNQTSPLQLQYKAVQMSSIMSKCLLPVHLNPHFDLMKPIQLNITTKKPILDYPLLTENYPDYEDYPTNTDFFKEATSNIINVSSSVAKVMAMTTAPGEGFVESVGKTSITVVVKDSGAELVKTRIRSGGIILLPSRDFAHDEHFYDILVTTWKKDIFWWNPSRTRVSTDIINCEFWHSTCKKRVSNFRQPFMLNFDVKANDTSATVEYSLAKINYSSVSMDEMNYLIRVHRVVLPSGQILFIHFYSMTSALEVVLTVNKFPTMEHFTKNTSSRISTDKLLTLTHDHNYDVFSYVGILVDKNTATEQPVTYEVSFTTKYCLRWIMADSMWTPSCKAGRDSNDTIIQCLCSHSSVFAGYVQNLKPDIQVVLKPDIQLVLGRTRIILATVTVTFCLFVVLLLLVLTQRKKCVYFLGDNLARDRFAYLLLAKTGVQFRSGTSSNVTVKLIGEKKSSEPHILNYPDPKSQYLQRQGKDMFLLTTKNHLGDLKQIELWIDCIGPSPAWYCKGITVYDLQLRTEWYFNVEKHLSVIKGSSHIFTGEAAFTNNQSSSVPTVPGEKNKAKFNCNLPWTYHTWFVWQKEENFSYIKKLTVITSTVLMTYTLALFSHGIPTLELKDGLDEQYGIDWYDIFVAFAASFPSFLLHICIAWCFRFSNVQFVQHEEHKKWLPFHSTVVCWTLLAILMTISTTVLVIFGFWVPSNSSWIWLTSCAMGISFEIFIYEIIFLFFLNSTFRLEMKYDLWVHFRDILKSIEMQRRVLYSQFGALLFRPYFDNLYKPLTKRNIKAKLRNLRHRHTIISELEDLFMFGVYVVILYAVILANKDSLLVLGKITMEESMQGVHTGTLGFDRIEDIYDMYYFINFTLIPSIHPVHWYENYVILDPALMIDMANKYIGVVRLRQHRMMRNLCNVVPMMRFLNMSCYPEFSIQYTESKTFGYYWGKVTSEMIFERMKNIWQYSSEQKSETIGTVGEFASYTGGGYIAFLGRTLYNSYVNFRKILLKLWIDHETRVVFIEFLAYNPNYNIFTSIRLIFERSPTGFTYKTIKIVPVRMLFVHNEVEVISFVSFFLFVFWVVTIFLKKSIGAIRKFREFYKNLWLLTDFLIILMSIGCIVLFIVRMELIKNYLSSMEEAKHNKFLSYFYLFYIENALTVTAAILVCIATVRLWKFLRFGLIFRIFEKTLLKAAPTLLAFTLLFLVLVVAYGMTLVMMLGNHFERIYSLMRIMSLLVMMAYDVKDVGLDEYISHHAATFFLVLCALTLFASIFVFIVIIVKFYLEAQIELSSETDSYTIKHYAQDRLKYFSKFIKYRCVRLNAGQIYTLKVEPKRNKLLNLNSLSIRASKMRIMQYITRSVLKNNSEFMKPSVLSHHDVKLMLGICEHFFRKKDKMDEVDIFYKGRFKGQSVKFVDEVHIEKIANIVNLLLQDEPPTFQHVTDPALEECIRKIAVNQHTLERCVLKLKLMLYQMDSIQI